MIILNPGNHKPKLVYPTSEKAHQPASIDLHLDEDFLVEEYENYTHIQDINNRQPEEGMSIVYKKITMFPLCFALASTKEMIEVPLNMVGMLAGCSTIARKGLSVECAGFIDPGFKGHLTLELYNQGPYTLDLKAGDRIAQIIFFQGLVPSNNILLDYANKGRYMHQKGPTPSRDERKY